MPFPATAALGHTISTGFASASQLAFWWSHQSTGCSPGLHRRPIDRAVKGIPFGLGDTYIHTPAICLRANGKVGHGHCTDDAEDLIEVAVARVVNGGAQHEDGKLDDKKSSERELKESRGKKANMLNRFAFGTAIGIAAGFAVVAGGWWFTGGLAAVVYMGTREYFNLVRSTGMAKAMSPPPQPVSKACSLICAAMPLVTMYFGGRVSVAVTTAAFILAIVLLLQREKPHFSQFSNVIFGLFYCGYLPSFWVKLRCGTTIPALTSKVTTIHGVQISVSLIATLISMSSIIAADTGAFLGGRALGRTPLSTLSPKKTLEGAVVGLSSAFFVTIILSRFLGWPPSLFSAGAFAVLNFLGSLFGDLIESMMKRDAGVKDSGRLIPGHGGVLDRVDSYVFTGALIYSFVKILGRHNNILD